MTSNATYVKTLSRRLNQLDQEIGRLVDEREAVRTVLSHEVPGEFDKVMLKSASDMRARVLAVIDRGEVIDAATVTARVRATGVSVTTKTVANVLAEHSHDGTLERVGRGKYGLPTTKGKEASET